MYNVQLEKSVKSGILMTYTNIVNNRYSPVERSAQEWNINDIYKYSK